MKYPRRSALMAILNRSQSDDDHAYGLTRSSGNANWQRAGALASAAKRRAMAAAQNGTTPTRTPSPTPTPDDDQQDAVRTETLSRQANAVAGFLRRFAQDPARFAEEGEKPPRLPRSLRRRDNETSSQYEGRIATAFMEDPKKFREWYDGAGINPDIVSDIYSRDGIEDDELFALQDAMDTRTPEQIAQTEKFMEEWFAEEAAKKAARDNELPESTRKNLTPEEEAQAGDKPTPEDAQQAEDDAIPEHWGEREKFLAEAETWGNKAVTAFIEKHHREPVTDSDYATAEELANVPEQYRTNGDPMTVDELADRALKKKPLNRGPWKARQAPTELRKLANRRFIARYGYAPKTAAEAAEAYTLPEE